MRTIPQNIKNLIINVLNCTSTDAIYIFGSYGTKYYIDGDSDIDIAWFTNKKIDLIMRTKYELLLEELLKINVDLVVVDKSSSKYLLYNIFEFGECIFEYGEEFSNWFDAFYDETLIDRECYNIYREEKNRYV
ncbi:MAG: nucleotidyltransferase domain-containing protein [Peptostreptococcaceae bacterium]